jgi:beta-RFAP synthase
MSKVTLTTPCRLHFGLFSFGQDDGSAIASRHFGGVGMMIEPPTVRVRVGPAAAFTASGLHRERIRRTVERLVELRLLAGFPPCEAAVIDAPAAHIGLGSGTQLSLAIALAVLAQQFVSLPEAVSLAAALGRGQRSAIGTYGFTNGGLLIDGGKTNREPVAPPPVRIELPASWRVLLLLPQDGEGVWGDRELHAFATLSAIPANTAAGLHAIANEEILPAARHGDFMAFSSAVYRLNYESGLCYAAVQGGAYSSTRAERWIARLRSAGVAGAGQSSWGPTMFAFFPSQVAAENFASGIESAARGDQIRLLVASPCNHGAIVETT